MNIQRNRAGRGVHADTKNEYLWKLGVLARQGYVTNKKLNLWVSAVTVILRKQWDAQRAEADAKRKAARTANVVEGRQVIEGEVVSIKEQSTQFGIVWKAMILADNGCKYWSTLPSGTPHELSGGKGHRIKIKASVKPSDRDSGFGFCSRPHLLDVALAETEKVA